MDRLEPYLDVVGDHEAGLRRVLARHREPELVPGLVMTDAARHPYHLAARHLPAQLGVGDHGERLGLGLVLAEVLGPHTAQLQVLLALDEQVSLPETQTLVRSSQVSVAIPLRE